MKFKNYCYFARNIYKSNKALKRTTWSMVICFILLITVLWLIFAFYSDYQGQLQQYCFNNLYTLDYTLDTEVRNTPYALYAKEEGQNIANELKANSLQSVESYAIALQWGDNKYQTNDSVWTDKNKNAILRTFRGTPKNQEIFLPAYTEYLNAMNAGNLITGNGFYNDGRRQIIISTRIANELNAKIGQTMSLTLSINQNVNTYMYFDYLLPGFLDNDNDISNSIDSNYNFKSGMVQIFKNYEIVGIFNEAILTEELQSVDSELWICESSLYNQGKTYLPTLTIQTIAKYDDPAYQAAVITYSSSDIITLSEIVVESGTVFPFFVNGGFVSPYTEYIRYNIASMSPIISTQYELNAFSKIKQFYRMYRVRFLSNLDPSSIDALSAPINRTTYHAIGLGDKYDPIMILGGLLGVVLGLATLIYFISVISFQIKQQLHFTGLLRAVGFDKYGITKLRVIETIYIFFRAFLVGLIISFGICLTIYLFTGYLTDSPIYGLYALQLGYFPLSAFIISFAFLLPCLSFVTLKSLKCKDKHISDILKDDIN